ncbi:hypothetical protein IV203_003692 [Nitzschia inconspicua]|uniref:SANT domain-containing protein n=1 Tax=Nitzschia inconspicua TaxID=303405 RepID=A0A9K3L3Y8_9STRA|nr:hypothetical protein IV203_003692 [Nitzschia inconspicua]
MPFSCFVKQQLPLDRVCTPSQLEVLESSNPIAMDEPVVSDAPAGTSKESNLEIILPDVNGTVIQETNASFLKRPREEVDPGNAVPDGVVPNGNKGSDAEQQLQQQQQSIDSENPAAKRVKTTSDNNCKDDNPPDTEADTFVETVFSPVSTRSQRGAKSTDETNSEDSGNGENDMDADSTKRIDNDEMLETTKKRWRVHQIADDYVHFVGNVMYPATKMGPYGFNPEAREYPIKAISLLHYIKSPLRRPSVMEKWSPYEVAVFEGGLLHYGKEFHRVSRQIGTKSTEDVIDFYYIWKKTGHYKKWKERFVSDDDLLDDTVETPVRKPKR